ncbi:MAG: hypothetical protein J7K54_00605 [Candidatus Aenigmarchaeota archaeon]|nr:hypothetical protein [Candidatus Aenigmarchaeota archaeon]
MREQIDKNYHIVKSQAVRKAMQAKTHIREIKSELFNMDIPQYMETVLRNRIRILSVLSGLAATIALFIMFNEPLYILASLLTGLIAMVIDFFIEYHGISKRAWKYPETHLSFRKVPVEVPLMFFSCGIIVAFAFLCFSSQPMVMMISSPGIAGLSNVQIALFAIGVFFMLQYFRGKAKSIIFWVLPISIALYLSFSEPWILVISLLPVYLDYYLEKWLVKSAHIEYDRYGEEVAVNVAVSYFPATLFIFEVAAVILCMLQM